MHATTISNSTLDARLADLEEILLRHRPLLIAYSGGVDSACLLAVAHRVLGNDALGVIADSPSLPRQALADALAVAAGVGARVEVVQTAEMENPAYASNPLNRCYYCKSELFVNWTSSARNAALRQSLTVRMPMTPHTCGPALRPLKSFQSSRR